MHTTIFLFFSIALTLSWLLQISAYQRRHIDHMTMINCATLSVILSFAFRMGRFHNSQQMYTLLFSTALLSHTHTDSDKKRNETNTKKYGFIFMTSKSLFLLEAAEYKDVGKKTKTIRKRWSVQCLFLFIQRYERCTIDEYLFNRYTCWYFLYVVKNPIETCAHIECKTMQRASEITFMLL